MTYPVAIKRYKMGRYILNVNNTTSAQKNSHRAEFKRIKAFKRRRNMTYAHLPTKFQQERHRKEMFRLITVMFLILATNFIWTNLSLLTTRKFIVYPIDATVEAKADTVAIVGQDVLAEKRFSASLPVLIESGSVEEREIYIYNEAIKHKVNPDYAIRIAKSESHPYLDPYAKNPKSTAKGIYQFIDSTFRENCKGDVYNWKNNVDCFMDNFNQHPQWWQESLDIEGIKIKSK